MIYDETIFLQIDTSSLAAALMLTACGTQKANVSATSSASASQESSSSTASVQETKADSDGTIKLIKTTLDTAKLNNEITVENGDTINIGLPMDLGITEDDIKKYNSYSASEKSTYRSTVKWDTLLKPIEDLDSAIRDMISDSKYKHLTIQAYSSQDKKVTYLVYKDGKMVQDALEVK